MQERAMQKNDARCWCANEKLYVEYDINCRI